ncbi:type IX secretion system outer membrane channel protein PorV [Mucilaginibacter sp. X4EP1]|uniref:type IX secretion system outer membrane channel protein PorV n=1 Tax=Mucilaginibacter sp. X4EP1 TaxID=2723092 RepID=UPI0021691F0D|nr:type IX secretion system outer membrane channel protein PorV [Mucilaginibacter sp. X4EP1]
MKLFSLRISIFFICILLPALVMSQTTVVYPNTEVPFLNLTPDSRSGAMGEAGVAISPDVNANYWNPSKLAFLTNDDDVSLSYSPWLRQLVPDISLSYLSYAHKIDDRNSIGASIRYFNYGTVALTDVSANSLGSYTPSEFQINGSFARKFGDELSLGLTAGYIHSSFSSSASTGQNGNPANAVSAGVSLFYTKQTEEFGNDAVFSFGTNISNIGSKISYDTDGPKYFLPTNLKIGVANTWNLDDYNQVTLTVDFNKLLTPTPPVRDANGNIIAGKDDNISVPSGIFSSFSDAPNGFSGELQEITVSPGVEYWYNQLFALRAGYFYENANNPDNPYKGGAHYLTLGVGMKYNQFNFDFSYIAGNQQNSPLANTLRFTLIANFGGSSNQYKR